MSLKGKSNFNFQFNRIFDLFPSGSIPPLGAKTSTPEELKVEGKGSKNSERGLLNVIDQFQNQTFWLWEKQHHILSVESKHYTTFCMVISILSGYCLSTSIIIEPSEILPVHQATFFYGLSVILRPVNSISKSPLMYFFCHNTSFLIQNRITGIPW